MLSKFIKSNFVSGFRFTCTDLFSIISLFHEVFSQENVYSVLSESRKKRNIINFFKVLDFFSFSSLCIAGFGIIVLLPTYLVFNLCFSAYHKYQYQYGWSSTGVYLTGVVPSVVLLVFFVIVICC
jgi:uncharacterized BrkB/YihY/UPF0761 family membrane protein